jgi:hypothetical protein
MNKQNKKALDRRKAGRRDISTKTYKLAGRIILKFILEKKVRVVWTGFMWPRIGTSDRLL